MEYQKLGTILETIRRARSKVQKAEDIVSSRGLGESQIREIILHCSGAIEDLDDVISRVTT